MVEGCAPSPDNTLDDGRNPLLSVPSVLESSSGGGVCRRHRQDTKENLMSKWNAFRDSTVVRISASAGTFVAVAVVVGAGFKWV